MLSLIVIGTFIINATTKQSMIKKTVYFVGTKPESVIMIFVIVKNNTVSPLNLSVSSGLRQISRLYFSRYS